MIVPIQNFEGSFQCEMTSPSEPKLYPNESVYNRTNGITLMSKKSEQKVHGGTVILTTHRIIYVHEGIGLEIPLYYVQSFTPDGGILKSPRIEISLVEYRCNKGHPPHVDEYYKKVLKQPVPQF